MPSCHLRPGQWWTEDGRPGVTHEWIAPIKRPEPVSDGTGRVRLYGWVYGNPAAPAAELATLLVQPDPIPPTTKPIPRPRPGYRPEPDVDSRSEWMTLHVADRGRVEAELRPDGTLVFHDRRPTQVREVTVPPGVLPSVVARLQAADTGGGGDILLVLRQHRHALAKVGVETWLQRQHIPYAIREGD